MNIQKYRHLTTSTALLAISLISHQAFAQAEQDSQSAPAARAAPADDDRTSLGDIIVTARKVAENLQDVPVAVTAFSGEALAQQNARVVPDVALLTPGLTFSAPQTTPSAVVMSIRGQVQNDTLATLDPSVGVYVDGLYWARAYGLNSSLVDIANVQTLKGPQGTLFGRNTTGGALLVNSNDPSFSEGLSGTISGTYGNFNYMAGTVVLNAPLIEDKLALRVAFSQNRRDGYVREVNTNQKLGELDDTTFRAKLLIKPSDSFRLLLSAELFRSSIYANPERLTYFSPTGVGALEAGVESLGAAGCFDATGAPTAACLAAGSARLNSNVETNRDLDKVSLSVLPFARTKSQTYSATATFDTSFGEIKAIGGYRRVRDQSTADNDGSDVFILEGNPANSDANIKQWSGEVTATGRAMDDKLDFVLGGFIFRETGTDGSRFVSVRDLSAAGAGGLPVSSRFAGRIFNTSKGVYAQATYHFTDALSFTGGLRYSSDKKGLTINNATLVGPIEICGVAVCPLTRSDTFNGLSYTAVLDYKLTNDMLVYAKTSRGFRSGGQNLRGAGSVPQSLLPFDPEFAYSHEVGLKSELFDHKLRLNLAGYYTVVNDIQRSTTVFAGGSTATFISNAAKMRIYGMEAEASLLLPAGFKLDGTAAYTHAKYAKFVDPTGFDRSNEPIALVPKWTASISPSWTGDASFGRIGLRADFAYQSKTTVYPTGFYTDGAGVIRDATTGQAVSAADAAGFTAAATDRAHWLINARASVTLLDGKLDIALWGRNLGNVRDIVGGLPLTGLGTAAVLRREPRTYGTTATVKF